MKTIQYALQSATFGTEYDHLVKSPSNFRVVSNRLFELYCKGVLKTYCPMKVFGRENLPEHSFIFCSNHCSHMDSTVLMAASERPFHQFGMVAARDYFYGKRNWRTLIHKFMNLIPVDRKSNRKALMENLALCRAFISIDNRNLIIYPEGTRSLTGDMQSLKHGAAMLSVELDLPIIPVYIDGTYRAWPKGKLFMKPTPIQVYIDKPLFPDDFKSVEDIALNGTASYRLMSEELKNRLTQLSKNNGHR